MESLKKSDKFLELLKKFQVTKPQDSSTTGKVVKRPQKKVSNSGRGLPTAGRRNIPILKPTPTKSCGGNPNFVSPSQKHRSAFVPILSPINPKDYMESVSKLRSGRLVQPRYVSLNGKRCEYDEMENCERGSNVEKTSNANLSSSRDSGFERSNPLNSSYFGSTRSGSTSASKRRTSPAQTKPRCLQKIPKKSSRNSKAPLPVFARPKTPPCKSRRAEEIWIKTQTDFVETVHSFTSQNMFTTPEILFHLDNLELNITKKISKSIFLNRISSRGKIRLSSDENASSAGSEHHWLTSWLLNNGV